MHTRRTTLKRIMRAMYAGGGLFLLLGFLVSPASGAILPALSQAAAPALTDTAVPLLTATDTLPPLPTRTSSPQPVVVTETSMPISPTETSTALPPTATNTALPIIPATGGVVLRNICAYPNDTENYWAVINNNNTSISYAWQSADTEDTGAGVVAANSISYFTTPATTHTVRLSVNGTVVDQITAQDACLANLAPTFTCTEDHRISWQVTNENPIPVDLTWSLGSGQAGSGTVAANATSFLAYTDAGAHTLALTWEIPPVGQRSVSLATSPDACVLQAEQISTFTPTPPVLATFTPTVTASVAPSLTASITPTPPLLPTRTATRLSTLAQPAVTSTPIVLPVTGADFTPEGQRIFLSRVMMNIGVLLLGIALLVTGVMLRGKR